MVTRIATHAARGRAGAATTLRVSEPTGTTWEIDTSTPDGRRVRDALVDYLALRGHVPTPSPSRQPATVDAGPAPSATPRSATAAPTTRAVEAWAGQVGSAITRSLIRTAVLDPGVTSLDPDGLAVRLAAGVPGHHPLDDLTGPFYDTAGLTGWLGVTRQALDARVRSGSLLMCPLEDGTRVYPAWQFRPDGTPIPHLAQVIKLLRPAAASPWTVATWLRTPWPDWAGSDAVAWLDAGGDPEPVITLARRDAARWEQ